MAQSSGERMVLEAATVIRVPPPGREAPYVVGAIRIDGNLQTAIIEVDPENVPAPGTVLRERVREDGSVVYFPAEA